MAHLMQNPIPTASNERKTYPVLKFLSVGFAFMLWYNTTASNGKIIPAPSRTLRVSQSHDHRKNERCMNPQRPSADSPKNRNQKLSQSEYLCVCPKYAPPWQRRKTEENWYHATKQGKHHIRNFTQELLYCHWLRGRSESSRQAVHDDQIDLAQR